MDIALVQGGGPQGTRARDTSSRVVFDRHLEATGEVKLPVDLVVWPEDTVHVEAPIGTTSEGAELAALARQLGTTLSVGVIEGDGPDDRYNSQLAYDSAGNEVARYTKVRRVPFGEWMPLRGFLTAIGAPTDLVPRDDVPGTGPAILDTPAGRLGVVISWEVFFGGRARDAIGHGGTVLLNPTNGASYNGTILQTQQIASSRLAGARDRALGRAGRADRVQRVHQRRRRRDPAVVDQRTPGTPSRGPDTGGRDPLRAVGRPPDRRGGRAPRRDRPHRRSSSSITVTGPSLTSSTAISVRKRPVATRAPSSRNASTSEVTSGSAASG